MKKIAIFAIFLIATIMTFGQLVPDQQFLAPARVKSLTTKFTRLIPAHTIVYVDVTPYVLDSTGYVGNTLSNMILKGTAVLQSGAVAASFVAVDSSYLHSTGTEYGYGTYYFPNSFYLGSKFLSTGDTLKPITNNTGFLGSPTKQVGSIYSHYCTGDWGAFTKVTGTYSKFTTDTATTFVGSLTGHASLDATAASPTLTGTVTMPANVIKNITTPAPFDSTGTIPAAKMLRGVIKCTSASVVTMTTPTATTISSLITGCGQGTTFDLIIDNTGSGSGAITLALDGSITIGSGVITGGNTLTVAVGQTGKFQFYFNSASAARCYRVF